MLLWLVVIVVIVLRIIDVISLRTFEVVVVAPRPLIPRFSAIKAKKSVVIFHCCLCLIG